MIFGSWGSCDIGCLTDGVIEIGRAPGSPLSASLMARSCLTRRRLSDGGSVRDHAATGAMPSAASFSSNATIRAVSR